MSGTPRRYRGFISYSQRDQAFAKRLHKALEGFKLPNGKKLGRFFRDDDELGGAASLGSVLENSIRDSEDLIVIASPNSAQSKWVNEEVIHFKKLADPNKQVFAVVIDGAPGGHDGALECFVPALRSKVSQSGDITGEPDEPLAPDARKEPFKRLVTKLVAGLEDLPFDDLWQREKRRARNRMLTSVAVIAAIAAPLAYWGANTTLKLQSSTSQLASLDPETQRANFLDNYYVQLADKQFAEQVPEEYRITREAYDDAIQILVETDLNNDGYQDYFIKLEHIEFCGSSGCLHEIVLTDDGRPRIIHSSNGGDLQVLTTSRNGMRDIGLGFGGLEDGGAVYRMLRFENDLYVDKAYAVCNGVVTYCGLSTVFSDTPVGDTMQMVFRAVSEAEMNQLKLADRNVFTSVRAAENRDLSASSGTEIDYIAGVDATGEFGLVHVWKGTYGVVRLAP